MRRSVTRKWTPRAIHCPSCNATVGRACATLAKENYGADSAIREIYCAERVDAAMARLAAALKLPADIVDAPEDAPF